MLLQEKEIEGVRVGSLVMPYSAFFRSEYMADTGFSKSRKRTRADVSVSGRLWSGFDVRISEIELAKVSKIVGKAFVFSYLTDVKILRPAIDKHMKKMVRNQADRRVQDRDLRQPRPLRAGRVEREKPRQGRQGGCGGDRRKACTPISRRPTS